MTSSHFQFETQNALYCQKWRDLEFQIESEKFQLSMKELLRHRFMTLYAGNDKFMTNIIT